jgi:hypothetical protein
MNESTIKFIISRVIDNANDALEEHKANKGDDFYNGKALAYYEILDTIKSELKANEQDLKEFGLDIDLEKEFL